MAVPLSDLIRAKDLDAVARAIEGRWGHSPAPQALRWLLRVATEHPRGPIAESSADAWSESSWLTWVKNRLDDLALDPDCGSDPAYRYGPPFDVEQDPLSAVAWRSFLERFSEELLAAEGLELWVPIPDEVRESGWMGFEPADEPTIRAAEDRLGRRLPPSLRTFYSVSNGWRATGHSDLQILPVDEVGWLADREPILYEFAREAENAAGPFRDDPGDVRLQEYREEGTRMRRCLVISASTTGVTWLLDPGPAPHPGEWLAGHWDEDGPTWKPANIADLMAGELRTLHDDIWRDR